VAIADVSGDGKPDLAVADSTSNTVSVLLGNGAGGFGAKTDFTTGLWPLSVAIGDVSGDGKPDLAVANTGANTVSVLQGNGAGGFGVKTDFATGTSPWSVAIGDASGDGRPDLAVANKGSGTVSVLLGNGVGGFGAKTDFGGGSGPVSVAIGDVSGDGKPDLAMAIEGSYTVSVLLGNGAGGFGAKTDFATGASPRSVAIGDVSGDGRLDLAVANNYSSTVSVLLGLVPTRIALTSSPSEPLPGAPFNLTATVTVPSPGYGTPTGTVSFFDGTTLLGTSALSAGVATLPSFSPFLVGHVLSAVYSGDTRYFGAISPGLPMATSFAPRIVSVRDVPNDQGGKVTLRWDGSPLDRTPGNPIGAYWIWRQIPGALALESLANGTHRMLEADPARALPDIHTLRTTVTGAQSYYWEYVGSQASHGYAGYSYTATTLCDSMGGSNPRTLFMVEAEELSSGLYWSSAPESGYSVDNLSPSAPTLFTGQYAAGSVTLHWGVSTAPDFATFRLYRGASPDFVPGPGNLVIAQADTGYVDAAGQPHCYKLAAVDVHGNESGYAALALEGTVDVADGAGLVFALEGVRPNPTTSSCMNVAFVLPVAAPARLQLVDVRGRMIVSRDIGSLGAGRHVVDLAGERKLGAGIYLVSLTQGSLQRTARVVVLN